MARTSSKKRRRARQKRLRAMLESMVGKHYSDAVIAGEMLPSDAAADLCDADRGKAIRLGRQLQGELSR